MAEQPINSDEIIDKGIFSSLIKEADIVIAKEKEIISVNKSLLASYRSIANASLGNDSKSLIQQAENTKKVESSIKDLNTAEINLINTEKAKIQLKQEEFKLQKALDAENRKQIKTLNELNGEYKKGTQDLARLKKELKELEFTGRTNGKLYKALSTEFATLDSKVKKAEGTVKEFQRNVGNYPKTLDSISGKLAAAFSVGAIINFGKKILETRAEFQKFEAVLTNTLGSKSAAQGVLERIQDLAAKTPFSVQELTQSFVKLANQGFKPTNEEIVKLGDLAASQGKTFDQLTEGLLDAQTFQFERLKEFGIRTEKFGDKLKFTFKGVQTVVDKNDESVKKYILSLGDLEGVSGGMAAIADTLGGKISNLGDNFDTFFNNLGQNSEGVFGFFLTQLNEFLDKGNKIESTLIKINKGLKGTSGEFSTFENTFGENKKFLGFQAQLNALQNLTPAKSLTAYQTILSNLKNQYDKGSLSAEDYNRAIILVGNSTKSVTESLEAENKAKVKNNKLTDAQIKAQKDLAIAKKKSQKDFEDFTNEINQISADATAKALGEAQKKELEDAKTFNEELADIEKINEDAKAKKLGEDEKNRIAKREKELKEAIDFSQKLLDLVSKEVAETSAIKQAGFDKEISDTQKNIETQRNLAQRGLENTLAEEEARKIQLERQKEEEKQQEIKRQKALAFFKLFASYAEKDPNTALVKALRDTVLAEAVSAAFIDGTENVGKDAQFSGNKFSNSKDGYIAKFDGDERILNPTQNKMIGNLSNEALADLAYKHNNGLLDTVKYGVIQSNDFGANIANSALLNETIALRKEIQSVREAINNKPVTNFKLDGYGNFISETIQDGFTKILTRKIHKPL